MTHVKEEPGTSLPLQDQALEVPPMGQERPGRSVLCPLWQSEVCQEESVRTIHSADGEEAQCGGVLKDGQELENME